MARNDKEVRSAASGQAGDQDAKSKGGRPRRDAEGDNLEKLTIRLTPKLKLGLDLLARIQGRSLSQAIEWALQYALVNSPSHEISGTQKPPSIWNVLDRAWLQNGWGRTFSLYLANPALVDFRERHACGVIERSMEERYLYRLGTSDSESDVHAYCLLSVHWGEIVDWIWQSLLDDANTMTISTRQATLEPAPLVTEFGLVDPESYRLPIDKLLPKVTDTIAEIRKLGFRDNAHHERELESAFQDNVKLQVGLNKLLK